MKVKRRKNEDMLHPVWVKMSLSRDFIDAFRRAQLFVASVRDRPRFAAVFVRDGKLVATNTHMIAEIYCRVPESLVGKKILSIVGDVSPLDVAVITDARYGLPNYEHYFNCKTIVTEPDLDKLVNKKYRIGKMYVVRIACGKTISYVQLNADYFDRVRRALGNIITLGYTDEESAVVFESKRGRAAILPII